MHHRSFLLIFVSLALLLSIAGSPFGAAQAAVPAQTPDESNPESRAALHDDVSVYLPQLLLQKNRYASGWITDKFIPVANTLVELRFYNGIDWSTWATTYTDSNGYYFFTAPHLTGDERYYVRWDNASNGEINTRLWTWRANTVTATSASGSSQCSFDIESIRFNLPYSGSVVRLPHTFSWHLRQTPNEMYTFNLWSLDANEPVYLSPQLYYTNNFPLYSRPSGFLTNTQYGWDVNVYSSCGYGWGFYYRTITFQTGSPGGVISSDVSAEESEAFQKHRDEMLNRMEP